MRRLAWLVALPALTVFSACSGDDFQSGDPDGGGTSGTSGTGGGAGSGAAGGSGGDSGTSGSGGSGANDGQPCDGPAQCDSGYCVDGVCCKTPCETKCQSCALPGSQGVCTPYTAGSDPEGECKGAGDGSAPCAGACDGESGCTFPSNSTECGAGSCTNHTEQKQVCSGDGQCVPETKECGAYECGAQGCRTSCSGAPDCAPGYYCDDPVCTTKKSNGQSCGGANECQSGNCVDGTCCDVGSCAANFSCTTGTCTCNGQTCTSGESCVTWYEDADNDGFGNPAKPQLGCSNTGPAGDWVKNNTDCYDANANAKPGQTAFFPTHRGDGSYDYDCNGSASPSVPNIGSQVCGICIAQLGGNCSTIKSCGFGCNNTCGSTGPAEGFTTNVACGSQAYKKSCPLYSGSCAPAIVSGVLTTQTCK